MEFSKEIIPKFIEAMNQRIQQRQKWLSDEATKFLSQLGTWDKTTLSAYGYKWYSKRIEPTQ